MANLNQALHELRQEQEKAQREVEQLQLAISAIENIAQRNGSGSGSAAGRRAGRVVSAIARQRMAAAQRARWARSRKSNGLKSVSRSNRLSPAARRKIAAAQKARWARFRAEQAKKAA